MCGGVLKVWIPNEEEMRGRGKATRDDAPRMHTLRELLGAGRGHGASLRGHPGNEWVALKGMSLKMEAALLFDKY